MTTFEQQLKINMLNTALSRSILTIDDQFVKGFQKQIMLFALIG